MSEDAGGGRTAIIVAVIGLIGVLAAALISNWKTIFPSEPTCTQTTTTHTDTVTVFSDWKYTNWAQTINPSLGLSVRSNETIVGAFVEEDPSRHGGPGRITFSNPVSISADRRTANGTCAAQSGPHSENTDGYCRIHATVDVTTTSTIPCP
jgi:hypothetical protein